MTAPAEAQGRKYETQVIRFTDQGVLLNVPPEIVPTGAFVVLTDVVANRDGTVQSAAGSVVLFTAANTHSIRRFENHTTGATFYIVGVGTELYSYPIGGGAGTLITTGFSGNPLTQVNYRIAILSTPYQYIGDVNKNVKVDSAGAATKVGIIRPIPLYAQIGIVPVASGAGNLVGDYDWRYTFARLVGSVVVAESNPSDEGTTITLASEQADVTVVASNAAQGDITNIRLWRRGGTLPDAWRLVTTLANANATYTDNTADIDLASAEIMQFDNDVIGTSVDSSGVTLADNLAVPLPYLWGALEETLFGCGDPNRPDVVYYSKKGYPESWPAENTISLDAPQDEAVCGLIYDGKSFVFTQEALYQLIPNIIDGLTWTPIKTPCGRGVVAPFAMCVGPKIWFVAKDGVYEWDGQGESRLISDALRPLFPYAGVEGYTVSFGGNSYNPVDYGIGIQPNLQMRLTFHNGEVWFHYRDIFGNAQTAVYNDEHKAWRFVAVNTYVMTYSDEPPQSVMLGVDLSGNTAQFTGGDRAGSPVSSVLMTGGHDQGFPRADKTYGDGAIWMNVANGSVTLTVYANSDFTTSVHGQTFTGGGLRKYIINLAGLYARHIAYQLTWDSTDAIQPVLYWIENSYLPLPEEITQRTTDWDDLGHPADKMIKGLLITADTRGNAIEINVEADGGTVYANFTIGPNTGGSPQTYNIGFAAFRARQVRIVPISTGEWKFYGINKWLFDAEPESLDCHDVYWGDGGYAHDKLIKGATIEADCAGVQRTLNVFDDQGVLQESLVIGPGIAGIPAIYELGFPAFRTRNVRIMECSENPAGNPVEPPMPCVGGIPAISSLDPAEIDAEEPEFVLTVNGSNFVPTSVVSFNGVDLVTVYVSAIQLTATVPAALIVAMGTFNVIVTNPDPGCGPSAPSPFVVTCAGDIPAITGLDPASIEVGSDTFTLTITGTGFRSDATATFNGTDVPVTFISDTELQVEIDASLIAVEGTYEVIVTNPPPGCGPSEPAEFDVTGAALIGLRFMVLEELVDIATFRIQEAGSRSVYRLTDTPPVGYDFGDLLEARFSDDASKIGMIWDSFIDGGGRAFILRVYDLGVTLTSGGTIGDDIFTLVAPIIKEAISTNYQAGQGFTWRDLQVASDGTFSVLNVESTDNAVVQTDPVWVSYAPSPDVVVPPATLDLTLSSISVSVDPRGTLSSSQAIRIVVNGSGLSSGTLTTNPNVAWWSTSPNPTSSSGTSSSQEFNTTITVDASVVANGDYSDIATDLFDISISGSVTSILYYITIDAVEYLMYPIIRIDLKRNIPARENWQILVDEALTLQSEQRNVNSLYNGSRADHFTVLLNAEESLVSAIQTPDFFSATVDLDLGLPALDTEPAVVNQPVVNDRQFHAYTRYTDIAANAWRARSNVTGESDILTQRVWRSSGVNIALLTCTEEGSDYMAEWWEYDVQTVPDDLHNIGHVAYHTLFASESDGYFVGIWQDNTVRTFTVTGNSYTLSAMPGTLVISPGESAPEKVRVLSDDRNWVNNRDGVPLSWGPARRPFIWTIGYGGVPPAVAP